MFEEKQNQGNVYQTQRNCQVADKIIEQCKQLTPAQMEVLKKRIRKIGDDKAMEEAIGNTVSADQLGDEVAGQGGLLFSGLATGYHTLDNDFLLGFKPGDVVVVGAYTGLGKSTITTDWCMEFAKQGKNVLVFALEDSAYEVGTRINLLKQGRGIKDLSMYPGKVDFFPMEQKGLFFKDKFTIIPAIEALVMTKNLSVVCIDMFNDIIDPINDRDAEDFVVALKEMCDKLKIVLITTSRLREPKGITQKAQWFEKYAPNEDAIYGRGLVKYLATKIITIAPSVTHENAVTVGFSGVEKQYVALSVCKNRVGKTTVKTGEVVTVELERGVHGMKLTELGKEALVNA